MKNYALLNAENIVINISVAEDDWDSTGWLEYTGKNCGIGYTYNADLDLFIAPKCHDEATFDVTNYSWVCANANHND
jgi:hypothetical protein